MSIPRRDPNFKMSELQKLGDEFIKAGQAYWEAMQKAGMGGALAWIEDSHQGLVIFTRGEYRDTLLRNIPEIGPIYQLGSATDDPNPPRDR